jgi:hypothetical protein
LDHLCDGECLWDYTNNAIINGTRKGKLDLGTSFLHLYLGMQPSDDSGTPFAAGNLQVRLTVMVWQLLHLAACRNFIHFHKGTGCY